MLTNGVIASMTRFISPALAMSLTRAISTNVSITTSPQSRRFRFVTDELRPRGPVHYAQHRHVDDVQFPNVVVGIDAGFDNCDSKEAFGCSVT